MPLIKFTTIILPIETGSDRQNNVTDQLLFASSSKNSEIDSGNDIVEDQLLLASSSKDSEIDSGNDIVEDQLLLASSSKNSEIDIGNNIVEDQLTLSNDPSTFCMLTNLPHDMIEFLIQNGPMQPSREDLPQSKFPPNKQNRSFQTNWYWKIMPGNIHVRRDWLSYSIVNDKIYCHSCIIFGRNVKKAWVKDGFSAWHKVIECMTLHEISEAHVSAALKLIDK